MTHPPSPALYKRSAVQVSGTLPKYDTGTHICKGDLYVGFGEGFTTPFFFSPEMDESQVHRAFPVVPAVGETDQAVALRKMKRRGWQEPEESIPRLVP